MLSSFNSSKIGLVHQTKVEVEGNLVTPADSFMKGVSESEFSSDLVSQFCKSVTYHKNYNFLMILGFNCLINTIINYNKF